VREQLANGYVFTSETDTEVAVHAGPRRISSAASHLVEAVRAATGRLRGAYALGVIDAAEPEHLVAARQGSPLVIGVGFGEHFIASDVFALLPVTKRFIFLEEGDLAELTRDQVRIWDRAGQRVERPIKTSDGLRPRPRSAALIVTTCRRRSSSSRAPSPTPWKAGHDDERVLPRDLRQSGAHSFRDSGMCTIVACGTSFHAALVARYWMESVAGLPCQVEVASEYRYRRHVVPEQRAVRDHLAVGRDRRHPGRPASGQAPPAMRRRSPSATCPRVRWCASRIWSFSPSAGPEIGVASTKAFTTQLVALLLLTIALGRFASARRGDRSQNWWHCCASLPGKIEDVLRLDETIAALAERFIDKQHALFLGRGEQYPIAMEGALKLKEISYIHAEAYAAGELKHGPLALIDEQMPVVAVAPNNALLEKLKSNLEEVRARGGQLIVFADFHVPLEDGEGVTVVRLPETDDLIDPLIFTIPLQLLAYHVAVLKGTDVDQPRNLAKSVTVE
jgi:glutamine---fructose-6-phosphate transaminase (isomerizing)